MRILALLLSILILLGCGKEAQMLTVGPETVNALETLKQKKKFVEDVTLLYPGAPDETTRVNAEDIINAGLSELIVASKNVVTEDRFWMILETTARRLSEMDSEEMDRGLAYMEEIMDIYGIKSSGGRLNEWRYGFDPS
jgi:hypothetical protein